LLIRGDRTALPRQQTLRALIEWSYDLLTDDERVLFRRLAVFAGSFGLDAAEAIGAPMDSKPIDVLNVLTSLVEKSLVALDTGDGRYRLLESIREYAHERLAQSGEEDAVRDRHLAYYVALADKARPELGGAAQKTWLERLDQERENILAAHAWCDRTACGPEEGLKLAHCIKLYWLNRGLVGLGHRFTVDALARTGVQDRTGIRARGLFDAGQICSYIGRYAEARGYLQESLAIARELGDEQRIAAVLQPLGFAEFCEGDLKAAQRHLREAVALARQRGNKREIAAAVSMLATLHRLKSDLAAAEPLYEEVVAIARELGDQDSVAIGLLNLAITAIGHQHAGRARELLLEAHAVAHQVGSRWVGQSLLDVTAGLAASLDDWRQAATLFGAAEAQMAQTGLHRDAADEAFLRPLIDRTRTKLGIEAFDTAEKAGRAVAYEVALRGVRRWLEALRDQP
jgi:tetratricopeptide (TPR) repeat protein